VISYFNNWIAKWPTVQDLAKASSDDVLLAWKGLGYYSRATRLHQAAQQLVKNGRPNGLIPDNVDDLLKVPGIGRYTAGAISSIVFGKPVSVLDGNVIRVLSRQLGLYANSKDKKVIDFLWTSSESLVKSAAKRTGSEEESDIPGRWNQAMMELGSTICTPAPKCEDCPIQITCRAYAEGTALHSRDKTASWANPVTDIEDSCTICVPLEDETVDEISFGAESNIAKNDTNPKPGKARKVDGDISVFFGGKPKAKPPEPPKSVASDVKAYCGLFPKKSEKKSVREEECVVCLIMAKSKSGNRLLIEQRPSKGSHYRKEHTNFLLMFLV
jgi:A/G-specific adenine glycosylase